MLTIKNLFVLFHIAMTAAGCEIWHWPRSRKKHRIARAAGFRSSGDAVREIGAKAVSLTGIFAVAYRSWVQGVAAVQ